MSASCYEVQWKQNEHPQIAEGMDSFVPSLSAPGFSGCHFSQHHKGLLSIREALSLIQYF